MTMKNFTEFLVEASLGRLLRHYENGEPIAIISACRGADIADGDSERDKKIKQQKQAAINNKNTQELRNCIIASGFGYNKVTGGYTEIDKNGNQVEITDEKSSIVYAPVSDEKKLRVFAVSMGVKYQQDSVLFIDTKGNASWIFTTSPNFMGKKVGDTYSLGKFHPKQIGQYFTKIGKKNFSFVVSEEYIDNFATMGYKPYSKVKFGLDNFNKMLNETVVTDKIDEFCDYCKNVKLV